MSSLVRDIAAVINAFGSLRLRADISDLSRLRSLQCQFRGLKSLQSLRRIDRKNDIYTVYFTTVLLFDVLKW